MEDISINGFEFPKQKLYLGKKVRSNQESIDNIDMSNNNYF